MIALKRLRSKENRFKRNENLREDYIEFMRQYGTLGQIFDHDIDQPSYILPHFAVIKNNSTTTRCCVVFDGFSKTNRGISLNDLLHVGPKVQGDLFAFVTRPRFHRYVLSSDVNMMFRQVVVHPDDRKLRRIIWRYDKSEPIKLYNLNTVTCVRKLSLHKGITTDFI